MIKVSPELQPYVKRWFESLKPKERLTGSQWAERYGRLEDGTKFRPFPYQVEILDVLCDDDVPQVTVMKSARAGYSTLVQQAIGYYIHWQPRRIGVYQPTIDDAEDFVKNDLDQILSLPIIEGLIPARAKDGSNTLRSKKFPGGRLAIKGANSPKEFRRVTFDTVILEEPDGYPPMAGREGNQVKLAFKRVLTSPTPKKIAGSSPTVEGASKIEALFETSTQEYRHVPCPQCGEHQPLVFGDGTGPGLRYEPKDNPTTVYYVCVNGCEITEDHKAWMDANGQWVARKPENYPHRGFHISQLYSQFKEACWLNIAKEHVASKSAPADHMVFVNQTLGLTYKMKGDGPPWQSLFERREDYPPDVVSARVLLLTGAVDVQKDRLEYFVWGWSRTRESWLIAHDVIEGSPYLDATWQRLAQCFDRSYQHQSGVLMQPVNIAVDAGFATIEVGRFVSRFSRSWVLPIRGTGTMQAPPLSSPRMMTMDSTRAQSKETLKVWLVGDHKIKQEMYGYLELKPDSDEHGNTVYRDGYIHLPTWVGTEFCQQLVAESWDPVRNDWTKHHANEALDGWKYARAMTIAAGMERMADHDWQVLEDRFQVSDPDPVQPRSATDPTSATPRIIRSSFINR